MRFNRRATRATNQVPELLTKNGLKSILLAIVQLASNSCEGWNYIRGSHSGNRMDSTESAAETRLEPVTGFIRYEPRQPFDFLSADEIEDQRQGGRLRSGILAEAQSKFFLKPDEFQSQPQYSNIRPENHYKTKLWTMDNHDELTPTTTTTRRPITTWQSTGPYHPDPHALSTRRRRPDDYDNLDRNYHRGSHKTNSYDDHGPQDRDSHGGHELASHNRFYQQDRESYNDLSSYNELPSRNHGSSKYDGSSYNSLVRHDDDEEKANKSGSEELPQPFYLTTWYAEDVKNKRLHRIQPHPHHGNHQQTREVVTTGQQKGFPRQTARPTTTEATTTTTRRWTTTTTESYYDDWPRNMDGHHSTSSGRSSGDSECLLKGFQKIGQKCYFPGMFPMNWFKALEFCNSLGLEISLAAIETQQEDEDIRQWMSDQASSTKGVWVGASDNGHKGTWVWVPTGQPVRYHNWGLSQPTGVDQHCLFVVGGTLGYQWADFHCDYEMHFLCEHHTYPFHHEFRHQQTTTNAEKRDNHQVKNNGVKDSYSWDARASTTRTRLKNGVSWLV